MLTQIVTLSSHIFVIVKTHYIFSVRSAIAKAENETSEDFLSLRVKTDEEKVSTILTHLFMQALNCTNY